MWAVAVVVVVLTAALLFARVANRAGLPAPATIVLVGVAAAAILPRDLRIELTPATLGLFLPALIFEGAWNIDVVALRRVAIPIAILAVPGVALTAACITLTGFAAGLVWPAAFALGAALAATDPIAVLALFRGIGLPVDLVTIVEGESIANDGLAAVLVQIALGFAGAAPSGAGALWFAAAFAPLAGIVIGVAAASAVSSLLRRYPSPALGIASTVLAAYGAYGLATFAHASGIFASAAAGIALPRTTLPESEADTIDRFWSGTSYVANALVFLLVGLSLRFDRLFHEPVLLLATIAAVAVSRALLAYGVLPLEGAATRFAGAWRHAIALAGIRGGLSAALALGLPQSFPDRPEVIDAVFAVVIATLVIGSPTIGPIVRRLRLGGEPIG